MEQSVETLFGATGENPVLPAVSPQIATRWMLEGCCHRMDDLVRGTATRRMVM